MNDGVHLEIGGRIVVRTPDRREYRGELVEFRIGISGSEMAVVRLDTGWLTSYPVAMVHPLDSPSRGDP
jgi:hypothetical protein